MYRILRTIKRIQNPFFSPELIVRLISRWRLMYGLGSALCFIAYTQNQYRYPYHY